MQELLEGIHYTRPSVVLLQSTGIGTSEIAARTCYDSFDISENYGIKHGLYLSDNDRDLESCNEIKHSDLLDSLAWTYFHHSILEHAVLTYLIRGTSRAVLQEQARHRMQSLSVRSTRYTGSGVLNAFIASMSYMDGLPYFIGALKTLDMFVTSDEDYNAVESEGIYRKLQYQQRILGKEKIIKLMVAKSSLPLLDEIKYAPDLFKALQDGKAKRNALDPFKHIVSDNWKVDLVVTFNLRSLKNYLDLRDSGAAFFQIRWLAEELKKSTPDKYLDLIIKENK